MVEMPLILRDKCNGCELCISVCACKALVMVGNVVTVIETEECKWCTLCEVICPNNAIICSFEIIIE